MTRYAASSLSRRRFLQAASIFAALPPIHAAWADAFVKLHLPGGPDQRSITTAFPQKGPVILQRSRPPLLEMPFDVFDRGVFTPNASYSPYKEKSISAGRTNSAASSRFSVHGIHELPAKETKTTSLLFPTER